MCDLYQDFKFNTTRRTEQDQQHSSDMRGIISTTVGGSFPGIMTKYFGELSGGLYWEKLIHWRLNSSEWVERSPS